MMPVLPEIPIVYFHSVGIKSKLWPKSFLTSSVEDTEKFFRYISVEYNSISLREYYNQKNRISPVARNPIVITFDDGYLDNWLFAFPLLEKYSLKATIFISPEFVDKRRVVREDHSENGFLSWDEMKIMEASGLVDIQSHTLTHTKYFVSDRITGFHHPGNDILYPAGNFLPGRKPYYIDDHDFEKILPYGYPLFEEESAVTARKVTISQDFINEAVALLSTYDFKKYSFADAFSRAKPLYDKFRKEGRIIAVREGEDEYLKRIDEEIKGSRTIIEKELEKKVEFLCWPHGDNNSFLHKKALDAGYLMTSRGKAVISADEEASRIPERLGVVYSNPSRRFVTRFKIKAFSGTFPFRSLMFLARYIKRTP